MIDDFYKSQNVLNGLELDTPVYKYRYRHAECRRHVGEETH